jgi:hypothetical protein
VKVDASDFRRSFARFAAESKRSKQQVLRQQAKLFVRDVVKVTPPNKNSKYNKPGGEKTVRNDIAKILVSARKSHDAESARALHKRYRNRRGRIARSMGPSRHRVPAAALKAELARSLANVGILASGWNAAAVKLGQVLPAWITRHGTRYGQCIVKVSATVMSITIVNAARFAGYVAGMQRRVQWAVNNRVRQMEKQMDDYATKRAAKRAGLKVN